MTLTLTLTDPESRFGLRVYSAQSDRGRCGQNRHHCTACQWQPGRSGRITSRSQGIPVGPVRCVPPAPYRGTGSTTVLLPGALSANCQWHLPSATCPDTTDWPGASAGRLDQEPGTSNLHFPSSKVLPLLTLGATCCYLMPWIPEETIRARDTMRRVGFECIV